MKQEEILNGFEWMKHLLLSLSPDCVDYPTETENEAIIKIGDEYADQEDITDTIKEGQQVLSMQPFPWEWVVDTRAYYSCYMETKKIIENPEFYRQWLQSVLRKLEAEAKRGGKL